ncbi:MAG TPA: 4Fe-4S binding protein, partial [Terriglobia bacterium]|nr:4Fe-4S binding protein [Terriglobia bacterium]
MKSFSKLPKWRRAAQIFFFGIFLLHLLETEYRGSLKAAGDARLPIPYPGIFLLSDPLIAILNALSTRALYQDLLWSLTILIPTFFLGRFFCGWICPLGTLNHFFGSLKSEKKRGLQLIESNRYKKWHNTRYYVLVAMLVAAVFGVTTLALMDPISLLIRSMTASVLPALNVAGNAAIDSLYRSDNGVLAATGHGLQFILSATILSFKQPHFRQGFFLGLILIFVLALNLRITRFWCRALCPLGALLGALSRFSILGLEKNSSNCDDCNRCLLRCQGGDDPIPGAKWRK